MMNLNKKSGFLALAASVSAFIAACSGNGSGSDSTTVPLQLTESNGATSVATCLASGWEGAPTYGTGITNASGLVNLQLVFSHGLPEDAAILMTCTGGSYFNEATGANAPVPPSLLTQVVLSSTNLAQGNASTGATPLTSIAAQLLAAQGGTPTGNDVNSINSQVAAVFGLTSITAVPATVNSSTPTFGSDAGSAYALTLAAISQAAAASGESLADYVTAIAAALLSGDSTAVAKFQSEIATAVTTYVASLAALGDIVPATLVTSVVNGILTGLTTINLNPVSGSGS